MGFGRPQGLREPGSALSPPSHPPWRQASDHLLRRGLPTATPSQSRITNKPLLGEIARTNVPVFTENCRVGAGEGFPEWGPLLPTRNRGSEKGSPCAEGLRGTPRGRSPATPTPGAQQRSATPGSRLVYSRRCENSGNRPLAAGAMEKVTSAPEASRTSPAAGDQGFRAAGGPAPPRRRVGPFFSSAHLLATRVGRRR